MFTFEDGPENATEQPVNVHPFNSIVGEPPLAQGTKAELSFTDELAMDTIDDDLLAKAGVLWFQITFKTSASCDSEVLLQSSNILTAHMVDVSVFAGVSP